MALNTNDIVSFNYSRYNKYIDLRQFYSDSSGIFYFHLFCTADSENTEDEIQPLYVDIVCNGTTTYNILNITPKQEWDYYHVIFNTMPINDISYIDVQIYTDSTGNKKNNLVRKVVLEALDDINERTFKSFINNHEFNDNLLETKITENKWSIDSGYISPNNIDVLYEIETDIVINTNSTKYYLEYNPDESLRNVSSTAYGGGIQTSFSKEYSLLDSYLAWHPASTNTNEFIVIKLNNDFSESSVVGVITQGRGINGVTYRSINYQVYTTKYKVFYSTSTLDSDFTSTDFDNPAFLPVDNGFEFTGNDTSNFTNSGNGSTDPRNIRNTNQFSVPVNATMIRINPIEGFSEGGTTAFALRVGLLVESDAPYEDNEYNPDETLRNVSSTAYGGGVRTSFLKEYSLLDSYLAWQPNSTNTDEFIVIKLKSDFSESSVVGVITQGRGINGVTYRSTDYQVYTTKYKVFYSTSTLDSDFTSTDFDNPAFLPVDNGFEFTGNDTSNFTNSGNGSTDPRNIRNTNQFSVPVNATMIRINPTEGFNEGGTTAFALRVGLLVRNNNIGTSSSSSSISSITSYNPDENISTVVTFSSTSDPVRITRLTCDNPNQTLTAITIKETSHDCQKFIYGPTEHSSLNISIDIKTEIDGTNFEILFEQHSQAITIRNLKVYGIIDYSNGSRNPVLVHDLTTIEAIHPYIHVDLQTPIKRTLKRVEIKMNSDTDVDSLSISGKNSDNTDYTDYSLIKEFSNITLTTDFSFNLSENKESYDSYQFRFNKDDRNLSIQNITLFDHTREKYKYEWIEDSIRDLSYVVLDSSTSTLEQRIPVNNSYRVTTTSETGALDGHTYTYVNIGEYELDISVNFGIDENIQTIQTVNTTFFVVKSDQYPDWNQMEILLDQKNIYDHDYDPTNKTFLLTVSGGFEYGDVSFSSIGGTVIDISFTYENTGGYRITATRDGSLNYLDKTEVIDISINKIQQPSFYFDMNDSFVFDLFDRFIGLNVSGGAQGIDAGNIEFETDIGAIVDESLNYVNAGNYTVVATKDGSANYLDTSTSITIFIDKANQSDYYYHYGELKILNDSSYGYGETIDLSATGGYSDGTLSFSGNQVSGNVLQYNDLGIYTVTVTRTGDLNFYDISVSLDISINQGIQNYFYFINHFEYIYDPSNPIIPLKALGGSGDGTIDYTGSSVSNGNLDYTNTGIGSYTVSARKDGAYYYFDTTDTIVITILPARQKLVMTKSYVFTPLKYQSLVSNLSDVIFLIETPVTNLSISGENILVYPQVGSYSVRATKILENYHNLDEVITIVIEKANQNFVYGNSVLYYSPISKYEELANILVTDSGEPIEYTVQHTQTEISGNYLYFYEPDISFTLEAKQISVNYIDISTNLLIQIDKTSVTDLYNNNVLVKPIKDDPYYTNFEIDAPKLYTIIELKNGTFTLKEIKALGYSACEVYSTKQYTIRDLELAGYRLKFCIR